jgi:hypothetical protein
MKLELFIYAVILIWLAVTALAAIFRVYSLEDKLAKAQNTLDELRRKIRDANWRDRVDKTYSCAACYRTGVHKKIAAGAANTGSENAEKKLYR